jgi:hypothetical protein
LEVLQARTECSFLSDGKWTIFCGNFEGIEICMLWK